LKPDKQGRLLCPFHEDKTPSLQVYYKTHTCYCFSSNCKTHGNALDVIDFIMHKENISKHEALRKSYRNDKPPKSPKGGLGAGNRQNAESGNQNATKSDGVLTMDIYVFKKCFIHLEIRTGISEKSLSGLATA
jgi:hypothetical protein